MSKVFKPVGWKVQGLVDSVEILSPGDCLSDGEPVAVHGLIDRVSP